MVQSVVNRKSKLAEDVEIENTDCGCLTVNIREVRTWLI